MYQWRTFVFGVLLLSIACLQSKGDGVDCYKNEKNLMLWDMAHYCISKARDIYFNKPKDESPGLYADRKRAMSLPYLEKAKELILELEENYRLDEAVVTEDTTNQPDAVRFDQTPLDCSDLLHFGQTQSGVYTIWPAGKEVEVYCDMVTDGGGWTVIQRRGNFSKQEDFFRRWYEYEDGFGNITQDFWLGNENIYLISNQSQYEIRFDLTDVEGNRRHALYNTFWLDDEFSNYTLHIGDYSGDAGDSMAYHNNHAFSTKDTEESMCAEERKGGWWYDYCTESNLNGLYIPGVEGRDGMTWYGWHHHTSLAGSEIKLRKKN